MTAILAFLKALPLKDYLIGGAVAAAIMLGVTEYKAIEHKGALAVLTAQNQKALDAMNDTLKVERAKLRVDTVKLFARIDTGHTLIQRLIDTAHVYHTDTVKITVEKLVSIDSTIKACRVTVSECGRLSALEKQRADSLQSQVDLLKGARPSIFSRCGVSVNYGAILNGGKVLAGPGASAGCRVWP
jgi:hypothetical protein